MTQAREPDDRGLDRTLRSFDFPEERLRQRRISRLEDTQVTWRELNDAFDRVYEEIDELKVEMNQRFDAQDNKIDNLGIELNGKLDLILRRLTGMGQGNE
jgi:predicted ATP-dependent Lon-type protease